MEFVGESLDYVWQESRLIFNRGRRGNNEEEENTQNTNGEEQKGRASIQKKTKQVATPPAKLESKLVELIL